MEGKNCEIKCKPGSGYTEERGLFAGMAAFLYSRGDKSKYLWKLLLKVKGSAYPRKSEISRMVYALAVSRCCAMSIFRFRI